MTLVAMVAEFTTPPESGPRAEQDRQSCSVRAIHESDAGAFRALIFSHTRQPRSSKIVLTGARESATLRSNSAVCVAGWVRFSECDLLSNNPGLPRTGIGDKLFLRDNQSLLHAGSQ